MSNTSLLKSQHLEILAVIKNIDALASQDIKGNAKDIAQNINMLAGKLKMHLMSEDQFLYPVLMRSEDEVVRSVAQAFNKEMSSLAGVFNAFVQKYNTSPKLLQNENSFVTESKNTFQQVRNRIDREDSKLYPLIESNRQS